MVKRTADEKVLAGQLVSELLGPEMLEILACLHGRLPAEVYLAGGTVRDLLLGRVPVDIDITVSAGARKWAGEFARRTGGTFVPLGREEDAARVVWQGRDVDFSSFREGAETIREELLKRDLTINSMAVSLVRFFGDAGVDCLQVIDPADGLSDLEKGIVRVTSRQAFRSDPLRLLRVFRFAAVLDFAVDKETFSQVVRRAEWISRPAPERISHELELIIREESASEIMEQLSRSGLLFAVVPELHSGVGMEQPASHHLDVFEHSLATLEAMVAIQRSPDDFFPRYPQILQEYLAVKRRPVRLRWAALLHDLGKPTTLAIDEDRGGRITFYNHDREGAGQVRAIAARLKWSGADTDAVSMLVGLHMRPFHLGNIQRKGEVSLKACLRLIRHAGEELPGLFLLGMADALAGKGDQRPREIEAEVATLFARLVEVQRDYVAPVQSGPPLLRGRDLIEELHLAPGPVFRKILDAVEEAHLEKQIGTREEALELARSLWSSRAGQS